MARNLVWLATERYPNEKIVVWTHNFHIVRSASTLDGNHGPYARERAKYPDTPVGEVAARELGAEVKSIALIAGRGWHTPNSWSGDNALRAELAVPPPDSLESALLARDVDFAYLDLNNELRAFTMNGTEHALPIRGPWGRVFDGVIYLKEMTGLADANATAIADGSVVQ